ncbi:FUN14 domain-containing protein 1-like [Acanthaster planci]|uniref:FUN14 domain-containing protein 1-like n=1 Tax=Acanthaster planci TaxID=133434 RepID=A0A8B7ZVN9_ACAPL|nr:FUN14 domain-containing protein 1-like [Acanthaster planci]
MASAAGDNNASIDDSLFEILEVAETGKNWLEKALDGELSKKSVPVQVAIGGSTGWVAGYLFQKVGKAAATAVGGGLLVVLIGYHTGHIKINWKKFEKDVNKTKEVVQSRVQQNASYIQTFANQIKTLARKNLVISGGFGAGFLLGMAM